MIDTTRDAWRTPLHIARALCGQYGLDHDAAADDANHVLPSYWTSSEDALAQDWFGRRIWCNPPYRNLLPWIEKAADADVAVLLLPARTDQRWFRLAYLTAAEIWFVEGRIQFVPPEGVKRSSNREGSLIAVFRRERSGPPVIGLRNLWDFRTCKGADHE